MVQGKGTLRVLLLGATLLAAAAHAAEPDAKSGASAWDKLCYSGFDALVTGFAGNRAADCGFPGPVRDEASLNSRLTMIDCARTALVAAGPLRFGYQDYGIDSAYCNAAVRTADGELIRIFVDEDTGGGGSRDGSQRGIYVGRCASVVFRGGGEFIFETCRQDPDLVEEMRRNLAEQKENGRDGVR